MIPTLRVHCFFSARTLKLSRLFHSGSFIQILPFRLFHLASSFQTLQALWHEVSIEVFSALSARGLYEL